MSIFEWLRKPSNIFKLPGQVSVREIEHECILEALHDLNDRVEHMERRDQWQRNLNELVIFRLNIQQHEIDALESDIILSVQASFKEVSGENNMPNEILVTLTCTRKLTGANQPILASDGVTVAVVPSAGGSEVYTPNTDPTTGGTITGENAGASFSLNFSDAAGDNLGSASDTWGADTIQSVQATFAEQPTP